MLPGRFTLLSVPAEKMPALYQSANVFLEAMACELPIVAPDSPRLRWIVGNDQFLVGTDDTAAIAEKILIAFNAPHARKKERSTRALSFSWTKIGKMYRDFLQELMV